MDYTDNKLGTAQIKNIGLQKFALVTSFVLLASYIVYFLIMEHFDLVAIPKYRAVNFIIQIIVIAGSIKLYKSNLKSGFTYLQGLALGCLSSLLSSVVFAIFIYIYLQSINPELLPMLLSNASMMGKYLTPYTAAIAVAMEGGIAGLLISFTFMQFFKEDALHNPFKRGGKEVE